MERPDVSNFKNACSGLIINKGLHFMKRIMNLNTMLSPHNVVEDDANVLNF